MKLKYMIPALGIILFSGIAKAEHNNVCREYTKTINIGGRIQQGYGTACLQPDGSWEILSEDPEIAYNDYPQQQNVRYIVRREYVNTSPFTISLFGNLGHNHHRIHNWHHRPRGIAYNNNWGNHHGGHRRGHGNNWRGGHRNHH